MDTHLKGPATNGNGAIPVVRGLQTIYGRATQILTSNNTQVAANDTVTIGTKVYTFVASPTVEGDVDIGSDADGSLLNLIRAINHSGTPGTDYFVAAANPDVTADAAVSAHAFKVRAILDGTAGNGIAVSKSAATLTWTAAVTAGGVAGGTTATGDRVLLRTTGATIYQPLLVELLSVIATAFNGTSPVVSIISTNIDGSGTTTEIAIADIVTDGAWETRLITADKIYYARYTPATGSPSLGNIYSFARVTGMGLP